MLLLKRTAGGVLGILIGIGCLVASIACSTTPPDAVSGATSAIYERTGEAKPDNPNVLIVAAVSKTGGTAKVAEAMAEVFGPRLASPRQVDAGELVNYSLVGFGSGIFDQMHHASIFEFVDSLPELPGMKAFIFECLRSKGFDVVGEYNCAGFNDNIFLKIFGGMNRGKPDAQDIGRAKDFAGELKRRYLDPGSGL